MGKTLILHSTATELQFGHDIIIHASFPPLIHSLIPHIPKMSLSQNEVQMGSLTVTQPQKQQGFNANEAFKSIEQMQLIIHGHSRQYTEKNVLYIYVTQICQSVAHVKLC